MQNDQSSLDRRSPKDSGGHRFVSVLTKATYAVVLAGGRGSRLHELTQWRAKPAVPFGGKFRIIDFTLSNCVNSGVRRIGVATQYKAHSLIQHLQRGWSFLDGRFREFVDILPATQQLDEASWYQGTADAVFQNLDIIRHNRPSYVLILSGDHIYKMDYGRMLASHVRREADLTVAGIDVPLSKANQFGVMSADAEDRITGFDEKPEHPQPKSDDPEHVLASMGIYVFNTQFLYAQLARDAADTESSHDFGKDVIPRALKHDRVFVHRFADSCVGVPDHGMPYWRDVGTIDAYWEANMELTKITPELDMYDRDWPIWTYQEQLPPAKFVFDDDDRRGSAIDSLVSGGNVISGATVRRSLLFSNVRAEINAQIEDSVVLPGVQVGERALLKRCVVDKGVWIPAGLEVGVDPVLDRQRFHVTEHGITLITAEMLGQKFHRFGTQD